MNITRSPINVLTLEAEIQKLRRELEDTRLQGDQQVAALKKKSQDALAELSDQLDIAQKARVK